MVIVDCVFIFSDKFNVLCWYMILKSFNGVLRDEFSFEESVESFFCFECCEP